MKKFISIVILLLIIPILKVNAIKCYDKEMDIVNDIMNFTCLDVQSDKLVFKDSTTNYDEFFTYTISDNKATIYPKKELINEFSKSDRVKLIRVVDGKKEFPLLIKNNNYVEPTTTTKTTSVDATISVVTVTLNPNNGEDVNKVTCKITSGSEYCTIKLPNLDTDGFKGWGTASSCKDGKIGEERVKQDAIYYACYDTVSSTKITTTSSEEETTEPTKTIYLDNLTIMDPVTEEPIDFGDFSRRKNNYEFKVLYDVEQINIFLDVEDGIESEIIGNDGLVVGENVITIKLKDIDNNTSEYTLLITRLEEGETLETTHYLKSLIIGGYTIDFNKETFFYSVAIKSDVDSLLITPLPENEEDTAEIEFNENLQNGSEIVIKVFNPENEEDYTSYTIKITKEENIDKIIIIGIIILSGIIVVLLVVMIVIKSKKNNTNNKSKEKPINNEIEVLNI